MAHIVDPADALYRERDEALERLQARITASVDPGEVQDLRREARRVRRDFALRLIRLRWANRHTPW